MEDEVNKDYAAKLMELYKGKTLTEFLNEVRDIPHDGEEYNWDLKGQKEEEKHEPRSITWIK